MWRHAETTVRLIPEPIECGSVTTILVFAQRSYRTYKVELYLQKVSLFPAVRGFYEMAIAIFASESFLDVSLVGSRRLTQKLGHASALLREDLLPIEL